MLCGCGDSNSSSGNPGTGGAASTNSAAAGGIDSTTGSDASASTVGGASATTSAGGASAATGTVDGVAASTMGGATSSTMGGAASTVDGATNTMGGTASTAGGVTSSVGGTGGTGGVGGQSTCDMPEDGEQPTATPTVTRTVDPQVAYQTTEGWGTSLAWFGNVVGAWSDARRNEVADALFDPTNGIGFNVIRYNIGGGDAPGHNHMGYGKQMPGFKASEAADYDFTADAGQRWMLDAAIARIAESELVLEAFSNSPPWWMTISGCASGAADGGSNLDPDYYDDFADYLAEVVLHFRDAWGVEFRTLEPLNEPIATWWSSQGGQEGCHFERADQANLLGLLRTALDQKGLTSVELSAPDESSLDETVDTYGSYDANTRGLVSQINTHAYSGSRRSDLLSLATRDGKRLWSSEVDGSGAPAPFDVFPHNHDDIAPGLDIAQRITRDLREMHVNAWVFWQAVESEQAQISLDKNWGLLHGDFEGSSEQTWFTKKYYTMLQYTRHIRPGYTMIDVDDDDAVAFLNASRNQLVIVQRNAGNADTVYGYDLSGFSTLGASAEVFRTSASENHEQLTNIALADGVLIATSMAQSITTYVVNCVAP